MQTLTDIATFVSKRLRRIANESLDENNTPPSLRTVAQSTAAKSFRLAPQRRPSNSEPLSSSPLSSPTATSKEPTTVKGRFLALLYCAVFDGDCTLARRMLKFLNVKSDVELQQYMTLEDPVSFATCPYQIVHYAVASKSAEMLQLVLFHEQDIRKVTGYMDVGAASVDSLACPPLHLAVALRDFELVRTLIAAGVKARASRGPPSRRISALQDSLMELSRDYAHDLDALVNAPVLPLYSQDGLSLPPRVAKVGEPWSVWVQHGEEERSKVSCGAWRVDTGSFARDRTPSPNKKRRGDVQEVAIVVTSSDASPKALPAVRAAAANDDCVSVSTPPLNSSRSLDERKESPLVSPRGKAHPTASKHAYHFLEESQLFRIAVLLLAKGAELIFNKLGLNHNEMRRLQQVTSAVQKALHRKMESGEDTGLDEVIGLDSFPAQDEENKGDPSPRVKALPAAGIQRLISSVTPLHERYLQQVIAARTRNQHMQRVGLMEQRSPLLRYPADSCCRQPQVGDAVRVLPTSPYAPRTRRDVKLLYASGKATEALVDATRNNFLAHPNDIVTVLKSNDELLNAMRDRSQRGGPDGQDEGTHNKPSANGRSNLRLPLLPSPASFDSSIPMLHETSMHRNSRKAAVFSHAIKVGDPDTIVGCVACIVRMQDVAALTVEENLKACTAPCERLPPHVIARDPIAEEGQLVECGSAGGGGSLLAALAEDCIQNAPIGERTDGKQRLFAGLIVEATFGRRPDGFFTSKQMSIVTGPRSTVVMPEALVGRSEQMGFSEGEHAGTCRTLPYCCLFVPLSDLVVVEGKTAVSVVEHRLRRQLHEMSAILHRGVAQANPSLQHSNASQHNHGTVVRDRHREMVWAIRRSKAERLNAEMSVRYNQ